MGVLGLSIKREIENMIKQLGNEVIVTYQNKSTSNYGGYEGEIVNITFSKTIKVLILNYVENIINQKDYGDLNTGDVEIIINSDVDLNTDDKVTINQDDYSIVSINKHRINNEIVAKRILLSKKI